MHWGRRRWACTPTEETGQLPPNLVEAQSGMARPNRKPNPQLLEWLGKRTHRPAYLMNISLGFFSVLYLDAWRE